jgi:hypothetical protein
MDPTSPDPSLPKGATQRRVELERRGEDASRLQGLDQALLLAREEELAHHALPSTLGGLRRLKLLDQDPISTTWECWELSTGHRAAIRVLRPCWSKDPVLRRRMARGARLAAGLAHLAPVQWKEAGDWPHLKVHLGGPSLSDLLPAEDLPEPLQIAAYLAHGLLGLASLHQQGLVHGTLGPQHLIHGPSGPVLAWFDPFLRERKTRPQDIADLGAAVAQLDPDGLDPMGDIARSFAESPPPNVEIAAEILVRTAATWLVDTRHRLLMRSRQVHVRGGEARLLRAVSRLANSLAPPKGTVCLRAGHDAVVVVAESDGSEVKGGAVAGLPPRHLPLIWSAKSGLDAAASRVLLRAFATRTGGDEERRARLQTDVGGTDALASQLCRWLSAQSRLRATRRLLELNGR